MPNGVERNEKYSMVSGNTSEALQLCRGKAIVNSITAEKERWDEVLPLVLKYKTGVVALCMEDGGMPENIDDRLRIAQRLVSGLTAAGVTEEDIYLDPLVKPLGVNHQYGVEVLVRASHSSYKPARRSYTPPGSREPICKPSIPSLIKETRCCSEHESQGQLLWA